MDKFINKVIKVEHACILLLTIKIKIIMYSREEHFANLIKYRNDYETFKQNCHYGPNQKEIEEWTNKWIEQNL